MSRKKHKIAIASEDDVAKYAPGSESLSAEQGGDGKGKEATDPKSQSVKVPAEQADGKTPAKGEDTLESLRAEVEAYKDKLLRAQAECANISKRLSQQHTESLKLAPMGLARDLLSLIDNFERLLESLECSAADDPVLQGVKMIADQLAKMLKDHSIEPIVAVGRSFDPTLHEAMMQDRDTDLPPGTVSREMQRGYMMNDRVLRPAKVAVVPEPEDTTEDTKEGTPLRGDHASDGDSQCQESDHADV